MRFFRPASLYPERRNVRWLEAVCLSVGCTLCIGCEPKVTELVGGGPDGASSQDAGAPVQEGPFAEPGGSRDEFESLRRQLTVGAFCGFTDTEERDQRYEVQFFQSDDGTYRYLTRCLDPEPCEPFGAGSDGAHGLGWELITLDAAGYGVGEIQGRLFGDALRGGGGTYSMRLSDLRQTCAEPLSLYFRLSNVFFFQDRPSQSPDWVPVPQNVAVHLRLKGSGPCQLELPCVSPGPGAP